MEKQPQLKKFEQILSQFQKVQIQRRQHRRIKLSRP